MDYKTLMRLNLSLICFFLLLNFHHCQPTIMSINFIENNEGLKEKHHSQVPLLEKVFCPPNVEECQTKRIYSDGSLYFYHQSNDDENKAIWMFITTIKKEGITQLIQIFNQCCSIYVSADQDENSAGSSTYRFHTDVCQKEVLIRGVSFGKYKKLKDIDNIINTNLNPVNFSPK